MNEERTTIDIKMTPTIRHLLDQKWAWRCMDVAKLAASWSKDPSRKVGCAIFDPSSKMQLSGGFNGLPRGVNDSDERYEHKPTKLSMIVHAEANAVAAAALLGHSLRGSTAYITSAPCVQCAALLIQAGVARVVMPEETTDMADMTSWKDSHALAIEMFLEAQVTMEWLVEPVEMLAVHR